MKKVSKNGNMYSWISHTWTPVRGKCGYSCSYCYVKRWGKSYPLHLDEAELRGSLGQSNYLFVCSGCDLFHDSVPAEWIGQVMERANHYPGNKYLWHTKNPRRALEFQGQFTERDMLCVTVESNRHYSHITRAPSPQERFAALNEWKKPFMLTIEPVMDFDTADFAAAICANMPVQVNIGADSGGSNLPEPSSDKLKQLITLLEPHTKVHLKKNLDKLLTHAARA